MLNKTQIIKLKEMYDGHKIIYVRFSNVEFYFRTLTRKEFRSIKSLKLSKEDEEDLICYITSIYPKEFKFQYCGFAGVSKICAGHIVSVSGFSDINTITKTLEMYQNKNTFEDQCMDLIKAFMPEFSYKEMEDWSWEKLLEMAVHAQRIAKIKGFEYNIEIEKDNIEEKVNQVNENDEEVLKEMDKRGIDPMLVFFKETKEMINNSNIVDFPFIIGHSYGKIM